MDDQATANRHDKEQCEETPLVPTHITVTVTPGNPKPDKEVPCNIHIAPPQYEVGGVIWLSPHEEYSITFNLPGTGPRNWKQSNAFCNNKWRCPDSTAIGAKYGVTVTPKGAKSITVLVPAQDPETVQLYRMNFEDDYFCDPIIVVGDV